MNLIIVKAAFSLLLWTMIIEVVILMFFVALRANWEIADKIYNFIF